MRTSGRTRATTFPGRRPLFYYVTDRSRLMGTELAGHVRRVISWGADFIQVREKDLSDRDLFDLVCGVAELAKGSRCRVLVNTRADIALAAGAHGVHLPAGGPAPDEVRGWLPARLLIGASAHSLPEARRAQQAGADYVLLSPVFPPESKGGYGPPLGIPRFRRGCEALSIPVIALGGIRVDRLLPVLLAGGAGVAGISLFQRDFEALRFREAEVWRRKLSSGAAALCRPC